MINRLATLGTLWPQTVGSNEHTKPLDHLAVDAALAYFS